MASKLMSIFAFLVFFCFDTYGQKDSTIHAISEIPNRYFSTVEKKIEKYSSRVQSKTEKTLAKLSKWESKLKRIITKANPSIAAELFGPGRLSFEEIYDKYKKGIAVTNRVKADFDIYRDKLSTQINYLAQQKDVFDSGINKKISDLRFQMKELDSSLSNEEAIQNIIKERKRELISKGMMAIGKNKHLKRINKEVYYYSETLRNYKELFSDPGKYEELTKDILARIPAFKEFFQKNSILASLFNRPSNVAPNINGLQTRATIQEDVLNKIQASGPNASAYITQQMQAAQAEMAKVKDRLLKNNLGSGDMEMPDFKPNHQKTKTFAQRLEYGFNLQFVRSNNLIPSNLNIGASIGYKINDKSTTGFGLSYKAGVFSANKLKLSNEGLGFRSFLDWKLKKQLFISGGFELNRIYSPLSNPLQRDVDEWQKSALIGLTKKFKSNSKLAKRMNVQLLYDFFYRSHYPSSPAILYRIGYGL